MLSLSFFFFPLYVVVVDLFVFPLHFPMFMFRFVGKVPGERNLYLLDYDERLCLFTLECSSTCHVWCMAMYKTVPTSDCIKSSLCNKGGGGVAYCSLSSIWFAEQRLEN